MITSNFPQLPLSLHVGVYSLKCLLTHVTKATILLILTKLSVHHLQVLLNVKHHDVDLRRHSEDLWLFLVEFHVGRGESLQSILIAWLQLSTKALGHNIRENLQDVDDWLCLLSLLLSNLLVGLSELLGGFEELFAISICIP